MLSRSEPSSPWIPSSWPAAARSTAWQLSVPLLFPQLGDQTVAFRQYEPVNAIDAVVVYIRRGDRVTTLVQVAIRTRVDLGQLEGFARRAAEKLAAAD